MLHFFHNFLCRFLGKVEGFEKIGVEMLSIGNNIKIKNNDGCYNGIRYYIW